MDVDRMKINAETGAIRLRSKLRFFVSVAGMAMVLLAVFNLLIVRFGFTPAFSQYRSFLEGVMYYETGQAVYFADILLFAIGSVLAWFT